jgi:hypothetical protein
VLNAILLALGLTYGLFVFYAAVMNIKRVRDMGKLNTLGKVLGYPTLFIGIVLDVIVNWFVVTFILLEFPREYTVTARLKRHNRESDGSYLGRWRLAVVKFFEPLLDPLDPDGSHLK